MAQSIDLFFSADGMEIQFCTVYVLTDSLNKHIESKGRSYKILRQLLSKSKHDLAMSKK